MEDNDGHMFFMTKAPVVCGELRQINNYSRVVSVVQWEFGGRHPPALELAFPKIVTSELDPGGQNGVGQKELLQSRKE